MEQYIRSADLEAVRVDQEWMILHPELLTVTKLNEVGGLCWSLLKDKKSLQELVSEIHNHYDGNNEVIERDVQSFLNEMAEAGLIQNAV